MKPFLLTLAVIAATIVLVSQFTGIKASVSAQGIGPHEFGWSSEDQAWKTEDWTADDRPYRLIRAALSQEKASHHLDEAMVNEFQVEQAENPKNPQLFFRWVYAATLLRVPEIAQSSIPGSKSSFPTHYLDISSIYHDYPLTHSYEFDRLHLIYDIEIGADTNEFKPVVKRLYNHNSSDAPILHIYAVMLSSSDQDADILLAMKLADKLVLLEPKVAMNHVLYGWSHYLEYWRTYNLVDYNKASQGYHDFLKLSSPTDPFRPQAIIFLSKMQRVPPSLMIRRSPKKPTHIEHQEQSH